jgi:hypothetical protein
VSAVPATAENPVSPKYWAGLIAASVAGTERCLVWVVTEVLVVLEGFLVGFDATLNAHSRLQTALRDRAVTGTLIWRAQS